MRIIPTNTIQAPQRTELSKRGWALQEQLLASQIVYCMGSELHWQCAGTYRTECGADFLRIPAVVICNLPRLVRFQKETDRPQEAKSRLHEDTNSEQLEEPRLRTGK